MPTSSSTFHAAVNFASILVLYRHQMNGFLRISRLLKFSGAKNVALDSLDVLIEAMILIGSFSINRGLKKRSLTVQMNDYTSG